MQPNNLFLKRDLVSSIQNQGILTVVNHLGQPVFKCFTIELPWRDNLPNISCIPKGEYKLALRNSPKYGDHIHVTGVPARSYILIHPANYVGQLRGCIAVGDKRVDLNGDGVADISNSKKTMATLLNFVQSGSKLFIS